MIRCTDVHKSYPSAHGPVPALRGVDLLIDQHGFYGVMGASGSGKSTLLHLLAALDRPDRGEVEIAGQRIDRLSDRALTRFRRERVGVVFQQFNLLPTMTAIENVELPGLFAGSSNGRWRARAGELLESLGLSHRAEHRPDALSGGEQQRVAIARALLFSPTVILADEPTGALDSRNAEALWQLLADVSKQHDTTIVMVTHEPAAATHCRRVFVLADGRIAGHIDTEGLDAARLANRAQQLARA